MSIERSAAAASPKTTASTESHGSKGKGKVKSDAGPDALAGGGFLSLLTSLESEVAVSAGGAAMGDQPLAADTPLPTDEKPQVAVLPSSAPLIPLDQNLSNDLAMLLAQAGKVSGEKLNTFGDERPVGVKGGVRVAAPAMAVDKSERPLAAMLAPLASDKSGDFKHNVDALLEQTAQGLPIRTLTARGAESQSGAGASLAESRALQQSAIADAVAREPALSGALLSSSIGDGFLRQADRVSAKSLGPAAGSGIEGIWGQSAFQVGNRVESPLVMADPTMLSVESKVADTVSYWVTQGVQNAELKLDGFGGQPVEVSISLKGDEAHIGFRTDQPEIRQMLEGAVAHLKELLTSEGLVLSGVSVGTSGQDGAGAQEQRSRPGTRQATITSADVGPTESRQRVNQSAGRAVDLFV